MGGVIPGLVVLGSIRKQAEQARVSKPVSMVMVSASAPDPWSLPAGTLQETLAGAGDLTQW